MKQISNGDYDKLRRLLPVVLDCLQERRSELSLRQLNAARQLRVFVKKLMKP